MFFKFFAVVLVAVTINVWQSLKECRESTSELPNTWKEIHPAGILPPKRLAHAACSVGDKVYVFGGCYGSDPHKIAYASYNDMWIYTESLDSWTEVDHTGDTPSPRFYHSFVDVNDTTLVLFGGFNVFPSVPGHDSHSDLFTFNVIQQRWSRVDFGSQVTPSNRGAHGAVVHGDFMYIFGGFAKIGPIGHLRELWRLNVKTFVWESLPMVGGPEGRIGFSFVLFSEDAALLTSGGCSSEIRDHGQCESAWLFKPSTLAWSKVESHGDPGARRATSADVAVGGIVYQFGGLHQNGTRATLFNDLHALETDGFTWMPLFPNFNRGPAPPPTFGHSLVRIENRLVLFGGRINSAADAGSNQLWEYTTIPHQ